MQDRNLWLIATFTAALGCADQDDGGGTGTDSTSDDGSDGDADGSDDGGSDGDSGGGTGGGTGSSGADGQTETGDGAGTSGTDTSGAGSGCEGGKVVHFVYFVEADTPYSESQRDDVEQQAFVFQQYFYEQLGATFYLNEPVVDVIDADHEGQWYVDTPDGIHQDPRWYRLGNIKTEVYAKLDIVDFDPDHRVVSYPTSRHDGRVGGNFGGAWMDGDDLTCISGQDGGNTYPYEGGESAHCLGHVVHEFGHVLGLGHEGPDEDCMQFGFYNNTGGSGMCSFSEENIAKILAHPDNVGWLDAEPGDTCTGA